MGAGLIRDYAYYKQAIMDSGPDTIGYIISRAAGDRNISFGQFVILAKLAEQEIRLKKTVERSN